MRNDLGSMSRVAKVRLRLKDYVMLLATTFTWVFPENKELFRDMLGKFFLL